MLQGVIFDMDGVIIDSHPAHRKAWQAFLLSLGENVSDADLDFVLDGRKRNEILRHFLGKLSEDQIREYGDRKDQHFRKALVQVKPIPGGVELLTHLRNAGVSTAIPTPASDGRTRYTLRQLELMDKFTVVVTGNDVAVGKPDPSIYRLACQRLGRGPKTGVAVEEGLSGINVVVGAG